MLACVCRPVTGSLTKPPSNLAPQKRPIVVTCEPRITSTASVNKKVVFFLYKLICQSAWDVFPF